ncbi:MAG: hypothetical protein ACTHU0_29745 [Kofleriaceae bacterium]
MHRSIGVGIALALASCTGKDADQAPSPPVAPKPEATAQRPAPPPPPAPRDPRIAELFAAGIDCTWNSAGLTTCDAATQIERLAFAHQGDRKLAASCAAALRDLTPTTRGLAAACMRGFNNSARIPLLAAGLDAFEAEQDPKLRAAIAWAFSQGDARESGVEPRVIALVDKLSTDPAGQDAARSLLGSMFPQYLIGQPGPPSRAAGDLALALARRSWAGRARAIELVGLLVDRKPEVCAVLGELIRARTEWPAAVETLARFGAACTAEIPLAVDAIEADMLARAFNVAHYSATRRFLARVPLSDLQLQRLRSASKRLVAGAGKVQRDSATQLAEQLASYEPPEPDDR